MSLKSAKLRTQLARSMALTALTALGVFSIGMVLFYAGLQETWLQSLSEDNRRTLELLMIDGAVAPHALATLISAFSFSWSGGYARAEVTAFTVLMMIAALCAMLIGRALSRKVSTPIELVTDAALRIAEGQYPSDLPDVKGAARETEDLIKAFRAMTRALEAAERETTESSAAIAHELRTPLTILRGRLQGMRDEVFEPSKKMTDGLIGQVDTLSKIVDDLSLLSHLRTGTMRLEHVNFDLSVEVERVLTLSRPDLEAQGFDIVTELQTTPMRGDPERIRQAVNALIENARRYAHDGKYLKLSTYLDKSGVWLVITDRGPGIDPAQCERVFERWWRNEQSRNRGEGGTGLGLSVVKSIVEAHGGRVAARRNEEGRGLSMTAVFPESPSG